MKVFVTGANGFVGRALCERLVGDDWHVKGAVRHDDAIMYLPKGVDGVVVGDIGPHTDWSEALQGVEAVVHLAARVHVMKDTAQDQLAEYRYVNTKGTEGLARMTAAAGVRRFVYVSSVKVHGEETKDKPFSEEDIPSPQDPYAISKWEAEQALQVIARETKLEIAILRPPLVYGPGVRANFLQLMKTVDRGMPLPLKSMNNRRSMIYLGNLVDAIATCLMSKNAPGNTFLVSDHETISTSELVVRIAHALGKHPRLFSFPKLWLTALGTMFGKRAVMQRLIDSLVLDSTKIQHTLNWKPPFSMNEGLRLTADWYAKHKTTI